MRRREFMGLVGSAAAWPVVARARQPDRVRRIGVLTSFDENDPEAKAYLSEFTKGLGELGWNDDRNVRMDVRWAAGSVDRARMYAKELVDLQPDVILAESTPQTAALQRETRMIPVVFVNVSDPVGSGFIAGLAHPEGNFTGLIPYEPSLGGKWLELLTDIAPGIKRVTAMFNPDTAPYAISYYLPSLETAARLLKVEPIVALVHGDAEIESAITALGREPGGGLVAISDSFTFVHRAQIILQTARNDVPAVYWRSAFVRGGGLLSYGPDNLNIFRRSAVYVDRILRGAKPADLPVQQPTKFELAVNLKTAKTLGLTVPPALFARADEVIE
jgi:putative tryptophan/tyrosine transport system substrate-binding protein